MAIKSIETTGKTIDEAVSSALRQLGLEKDDVSIEVLDRGKAGIFGFFGASPARVRVSYGLEDEPAAPVPASKPAEAVRPAEKQPPVQKAAARPQRTERTEPEKPAPRAEPKAVNEPEAPAPASQEDYGPPCSDEKAQKITAFLTGLLEHMGSEAEVKVYKPEEGRYKVILEGNQSFPWKI